MYIRFVVGSDQDSHRHQTGVITEARFLREDGKLSEAEDEILEEVYDWLNANIPVPPFEKSDWPRSAVSYFRDDALEGIHMMRRLSLLLEEHGEIVRVIRTDNPGKILYEDQFQVIVEEWRVQPKKANKKSRPR